MRPIRIIGGGLAGLTLGIALRRHEIPVTICEAGVYPRHRVCGEFISGRGLNVLQHLGLYDLLKSAGARDARTAAFFTDGRQLGLHRLPKPALCISRHVLDALLADAFTNAGGQLQTNTRVHPIVESEGVVIATGRRPEPTDQHGARWIGIKLHLKGQLRADLEMHIRPDCYIGFCQLADGVVNVCGLIRARGPYDPSAFDLNFPNAPQVAEAKSHANPCVIAALRLEPQSIDPKVCRIGDALTMIPPITGNGMSMAFECAEIAAEPLACYARGERSWFETMSRVAEKLEAAFGSRLRWAQRLHHVLFTERGRKHVAPFVMRCQWGWRAAFALTR
jgi:menaquinone-9 beta-reductase